MAAIPLAPILDFTDKPMSTIYINSHFGGNWWTVGGASGAVAVYQPKGAASLAASYLDLSGNGNNAAPGVAPTWNAVNGWIFNGTTQYLITPNVLPNDAARTVLIQFTDAATTSNRGPIGFYNNVGGINTFLITLNHPASNGGVGFFNGNDLSVGHAPTKLSGNLAIAGKTSYRDGAFSDTIPAGVTTTTPISSYIGATNINGTASIFLSLKVQAVAFYNNTLTATQVAAVSAAMTAL